MPTAGLADYELHYEVYGSGHPLLLIAGTGSTHTSWLEQIPSYADRFTCIAYDARGIGSSTTDAKPLTVKDLAMDALAILDHLGVDRCHVIGTSLGAATAQEMYFIDSGRISRMILHAPWDRTRAYPHLAHQFELRIELIQRGDIELYERLSSLWLFSPEYYSSSIAPPADRKPRERSTEEWQSLVRLFEACLLHDVRQRLAAVNAPTLVTVGADDFLIRPSYADHVAKGIPGARLVVWPRAGHLARTEQPETFARATLSFLTG